MFSVGKVSGLARLSFPACLPRNSRLLLFLFERTTPAKSAEQRLSANEIQVHNYVGVSRGSAAIAYGLGYGVPGVWLLSLTTEQQGYGTWARLVVLPDGTSAFG